MTQVLLHSSEETTNYLDQYSKVKITVYMIVKRFGCTAIHNKALYKCIIHSFIQPTSNDLSVTKSSKMNY